MLKEIVSELSDSNKQTAENTVLYTGGDGSTTSAAPEKK